MNKGYENALLLVTKAIDKVMLGGKDIREEDLMISKLLGQDLIKYKSLLPHVYLNSLRSAVIDTCSFFTAVVISLILLLFSRATLNNSAASKTPVLFIS